MPTDCSVPQFEFGVVEGRRVVAAFDGGMVTSDAGGTAQGEADRGQPSGEARRPARPGSGDARQALGEDAPFTAGIDAEQAAHPEPEHDRVLAPGQVGEGPFVAAVDTAGPSAAQGTAYRALPRAEGQGDCGSGGLMRPGFEPDQSRIRQQAGE